MAIERMLSEETPAHVLVARVLAEAGMVEYVSSAFPVGIPAGSSWDLARLQNQVRMVTVREESRWAR